MAQIILDNIQEIADDIGKYVRPGTQPSPEDMMALEYVQAVALIDIARSLRIIAEDHK